MNVAYYLPVLLVVVAGIVYHNASKGTAIGANPFLSLFVSYLVSTILALLLYAFGKKDNILSDLKNLNWTSWVLGIAIFGVEIGYILIYKAGWEISKASLVANICIAVILVAMGVMVYSEAISPKQWVGIALCISGLVLVNLK